MCAETLSDVVDRLTASGYTDDFRAEADGLRAMPSGCVHTPETLDIDEVVRFEGLTNPDDEAIVFALRCRTHGTKGTYVTSYGPQMVSCDADMVAGLHRRMREERSYR